MDFGERYSRDRVARRAVRRPVRHRRALDRHLLPTSCPAPRRSSRTSPSTARVPAGAPRRLPRVQALPARGDARQPRVGPPRGRRRPGDAPRPRRRRRTRRRPRPRRRVGYSERQLNRILMAELGAGPEGTRRAHRAQTARALITGRPADRRRRLRRGLRQRPPVQRHRARGLRPHPVGPALPVSSELGARSGRRRRNDSSRPPLPRTARRGGPLRLVRPARGCGDGVRRCRRYARTVRLPRALRTSI